MAQVSACNHVLLPSTQAYLSSRDRIKLGLGVLRKVMECWDMAGRSAREVVCVARELLGIGGGGGGGGEVKNGNGSDGSGRGGGTEGGFVDLGKVVGIERLGFSPELGRSEGRRSFGSSENGYREARGEVDCSEGYTSYSELSARAF
jgi:hypothetical protein